MYPYILFRDISKPSCGFFLDLSKNYFSNANLIFLSNVSSA
ncbi:hypothetical protein LEP1GSC021_2559 [Leptospira noguchii str. 1993005606]|uniref:Uncharacterized protein n=1 Tax=Leptospira noguchii str. 2007001578 TaxID=1049974 RepID=A0ABP2T2C3_9LEPT|nr:hypothetical protein LEP1GSC035_0558 [Leptospira noguchii str. 2007001578]EPE82967.1 hypothetical protein LEP1GSC021_2559 [Leptospira noguchii str. 1993005606]